MSSELTKEQIFEAIQDPLYSEVSELMIDEIASLDSTDLACLVIKSLDHVIADFRRDGLSFVPMWMSLRLRRFWFGGAPLSYEAFLLVYGVALKRVAHDEILKRRTRKVGS